MRKRTRKDINQNEIVSAFKTLGCTVLDLHLVGGGCPDLLVGVNGLNLLIEVKSGKNTLRQNQIDWAANWNGQSAVVNTVDDVISIVNAWRSKAVLI
jgi:Holliday junction resolvase